MKNYKNVELIYNALQTETATRKQILEVMDKLNIKDTTLLRNLEKVSHGLYRLRLINKNAVEQPQEQPVSTKWLAVEDQLPPLKMIDNAVEQPQEQPVQSYVPSVDSMYVPFGEYKVLFRVIKSKKFFPVLVTGDSGNGKTKMVEQVCAKAGREFFRMNISNETDEMDMLGHYNLINGDTVWEDSPLVTAAKRGGIVLLDEIFAGNPSRMFAMQGILEGLPFLIKKTGEYVVPAEGFNIIATDNTNGDGSTSKYVGVNVQNSAFLERFAISIRQEYPTKAVEMKILKKFNTIKNINAPEAFLDNLAQWAAVTRKAYSDGVLDDLITTRRLLFILECFDFVKCREEAITLAINRFDGDVKDAFMSLYKKIDGEVKDEQHEPIILEDTVSLAHLVKTLIEKYFRNLNLNEDDVKLVIEKVSVKFPYDVYLRDDIDDAFLDELRCEIRDVCVKS